MEHIPLVKRFVGAMQALAEKPPLRQVQKPLEKLYELIATSVAIKESLTT